MALSSGYKRNARNLLCFAVLHALWLSAQVAFIEMDRNPLLCVSGSGSDQIALAETLGRA